MKIKVKDISVGQLSALCAKQEYCYDDCPLHQACGLFPVNQFDLEAEVDIPDDLLTEPAKKNTPNREYDYPGCACC